MRDQHIARNLALAETLDVDLTANAHDGLVDSRIHFGVIKFDGQFYFVLGQGGSGGTHKGKQPSCWALAGRREGIRQGYSQNDIATNVG